MPCEENYADLRQQYPQSSLLWHQVCSKPMEADCCVMSDSRPEEGLCFDQDLAERTCGTAGIVSVFNGVNKRESCLSRQPARGETLQAEQRTKI